MSKKSPQEIAGLFCSCENKTSWYNFSVGKVIDNDIMSMRAILDNTITNTETGHVLLRFCVKDNVIDLMFKPEDIVVKSSILKNYDPIGFNSIEDALKAISDAADEKDM